MCWREAFNIPSFCEIYILDAIPTYFVPCSNEVLEDIHTANNRGKYLSAAVHSLVSDKHTLPSKLHRFPITSLKSLVRKGWVNINGSEPNDKGLFTFTLRSTIELGYNDLGLYDFVHKVALYV